MTEEERVLYNQRRCEKRKKERAALVLQRDQGIMFYDETGTLSHRICKACNKKKTISEYTTKGRKKCRECENGMHLKRRYGMTYDDKRHMYANQNGKCAICARKIGFKLSFIDHDHDTGNVRGLLCPNCNTYLGILGDGKEMQRLHAIYFYILSTLDEQAKKTAVAESIAMLQSV